MSDLLAHPAPGDGDLLFRLSRGDESAHRLLHDRHQAAVFEGSPPDAKPTTGSTP